MMDLLGGLLGQPRFWSAVLTGLGTNVLLAVCALAVATVLGVPLGVLRTRARGWLALPLNVGVALVRATPLLMLILWMFLLLQAVLVLDMEPLLIGAIALSIYATVGVSDIVSSGAKSVCSGSIRAAQCL